MAKLRRDTLSSAHGGPSPTGSPTALGATYIPELNRSLRIVSSGTLFLTHTLYIPHHPTPSSAIRAHAVEKARGGSANTLLSALAQFPAIEAVLVAPLGGNEEGRRILRELENEGVNTQYCKIWPNAGVPSAWVLNSAQDNARTVINHNPLPDITHEDFVSLLGPLLAPENYPENYAQLQQQQFYQQAPNLIPPQPPPRVSQSSGRPHLSNPNSPAPFDWLHFEGRSVKTTLNNIVGLDGLARERKWRSHCVFSMDVGRKVRQGVEALIPYVDVIFLNKQYAQAQSPDYANSPRTFLLSLASTAPPHALLVAHWGKDGAAVLSLPTREYFQSSPWVEERPPSAPPVPADSEGRPAPELRSVRSGSVFWADGRSRSSSNAYTLPQPSDVFMEGNSTELDRSFSSSSHRTQTDSRMQSLVVTEGDADEDDQGSQGTERGAGVGPDASDAVGESGAHDAFIAGMIYALSRRICPGAPYTPSAGGRENGDVGTGNDDVRARWRLDECLRFATEMAGRKARRKTWDGLAEEMIRAGWFDL
ncbi:hypothetical protein P691DRAFT_664366 [Macrolepiota fuliginosa MF-IS2]|uniref:Carbohydrate kinase PfkB domain-containing protein n=1 Tax=Macrolepiota fuliginosa MF-IS2 TaxID=1400762 RepID=A0A9P5XGC8_9AGAR|nr:hypothetical protein P691DRAFT_664366 [Macrolepiota fuliginosa MF-IS2]